MKKLLSQCKQRIRAVLDKNRMQNRIKTQFVGQSGVSSTSVFSNRTLAVVIALVTLFLQIISFMTTWQGAEVYFGGIFILAPLFFALAIQSIVYFLSNSLRNRVSILRVAALAVAICCSTYFSYIGIYNTVNSPEQYLRDRYGEVYQNLNSVYDGQSSKIIAEFKDSVNGVLGGVQSAYAVNQSKLTDLESCQAELDKAGSRVSGSMTAPRQRDYENYEDYAAAYNAYLQSVSGNSSLEYANNIKDILSRYGYEDQQTFAQALGDARSRQQTIESTVASLASLAQPDAPGEDFTSRMESIRSAMVALLDSSDLESEQFETVSTLVSELVSLSGGEEASSAEILSDLKRLSSQLQSSEEPLMRKYEEVKAGLADQTNQNRAMFDLKAQLDSEIQDAVTRINNISPMDEQLNPQSEEYRVYDMYVLPVKNLMTPKTAPMAALCLTLAALVDLLTVLFAIILKRHSSILSVKKVSDVQHAGEEAFSELILSSLMFSGEGEDRNSVASLVGRLYSFVRSFRATDAALEQGYSLCAGFDQVKEYSVLLSILCQLNYARIVPREYFEVMRRAPYNYAEIDGAPAEQMGSDDVVLLKSRFVLWVNQKFSRYITAEEEV